MGNNFNENLRDAREKKGYSQKEVAEKIGVAKSTYSLYESGNREPNIRMIRKISDILSVSANDLLGIDSEPPSLVIHFDDDMYTEEELERIKEYAAFVKATRKQ